MLFHHEAIELGIYIAIKISTGTLKKGLNLGTDLNEFRSFYFDPYETVRHTFYILGKYNFN